MTLHALSHLDGRYEKETSALWDFFSEFAYLRSHARLKLDFLTALSKIGIISSDTLSKSDGQSDPQSFTDKDALKIQEHEKTMRHDVEAIDIDEETRERLKSLSSETYLGVAIQITDNAIRESELGNREL